MIHTYYYTTGGGMGWNEMRGGKNPTFGAAMMPIGTYVMAHTILISHRDIQSAVGAILDSHHLISTLHWYYLFQL